MRGSGKNRSQRVVCYERYKEERTPAGPRWPASGRMQLEWDLPPDAELTSRLSERPAWYWELVAEAETPGIDYQARFLLPVYAQP